MTTDTELNLEEVQFSTLLRLAMAAKDWNQHMMGAHLGVTHVSIHNWSHQKYAPKRIDQIRQKLYPLFNELV